MPIHDWTRVDAGIWHDFHHAWIEEIKRTLNHGALPREYYALAEQITGPLGPDVLTLRRPIKDRNRLPVGDGGACVTDAQPKLRYHIKAQSGRYAQKTKSVVIRHISKHKIIAIVEIVSPGNKDSDRRLNAFVRKAEDALEAGIHLLIADLFPPGPRDPEGIHGAIWGGREKDDYEFSSDQPLTCVAYFGGDMPEAFIEPLAVGDKLPKMPLFLKEDLWVPVPMEKTYQAAWDAVPEYWRGVVAGGRKR
jgi:hypothetical protein